jgi:putative ABC transport system ATP-binding protein
MKQPCFNLSGGQKQTLAFLSATINNSPILLLDEFLAATDNRTSSLLREMTRNYAKESPACVLIVSHSVDIALEDADKIILLKEGKLLHSLCRGGENWNKPFLQDFLQE